MKILDFIFLIPFGLFCLFFLVLIILSIIEKYSNSKWYCNVMGWHKSPELQGFDGCSFTGVCPRCGKSVLQDSQGNWF